MSGNNKTNLFIISSVISFKAAPLSYSNQRSIFTSSERANQTLETINSIRKKVKNSYIVLIESGLSGAIKQDIINGVDLYIYIGNDFFVRKFTDGPNKGLGECFALLKGIKEIKPQGFKYIFKISGRYRLSNSFDIDRFTASSDFTFKKYTNPDQVSTRLYSFNARLLQNWRSILKACIVKLAFGKSIEQALYEKTLKFNNHYIDVLGVEGQVGPDGSKLTE